MKPIRVMIVDDHAMVRQGLRTFLSLNPQIEVVGEASNGAEGVALAADVAPDIVLMDLVMPELDGIGATQQITALPSPPKVLVLTSFIEDEKVFPALEAGAQGYLLKDVEPDDLVKAILSAHEGEAQLHPKVTQKLMKVAVRPKRATTETLPHEALTQREFEVLILIAEGLNNKNIGKKLHISLKTVKTHVSNILAKLDLDDRTQAAIYAIKNNLTSDS